MPTHTPPVAAAIAELANALQVAAPIATQLRDSLGDQALELLQRREEARALETALERAVRAVRQLQPGGAQ